MTETTGILEGCSWDEHTHAVAADAQGLSALADAIESAIGREQLEAVSLQESNHAGFSRRHARLDRIRIKSADSGAIRFAVIGKDLLIESGPAALTSLAKSLRALATQERKPGQSSPRLVPRWFEGNDFLHRDSDELAFFQLPIEPALRP